MCWAWFRALGASPTRFFALKKCAAHGSGLRRGFGDVCVCRWWVLGENMAARIFSATKIVLGVVSGMRLFAAGGCWMKTWLGMAPGDCRQKYNELRPNYASALFSLLKSCGGLVFEIVFLAKHVKLRLCSPDCVDRPPRDLAEAAFNTLITKAWGSMTGSQYALGVR